MSDKYAAERVKPIVPLCGTDVVELSFDGQHLQMTGAMQADGGTYRRKASDGTLRYPAVSGQPVSRGKFDYSKSNQARPNQGPIPAGRYWINPSEMWERDWKREILLSASHKIAWGDYRITIHPYPSTQTHGRGGFFIHGGAVRGSSGCIDLTLFMPDFAKDLRHNVGKKNNCFINLTVTYG